MAGAGKKTFTAGEILTASDTNTYLMEQTVMNFAGTAARASAIPTPTEGMVSYRSDIDNLQLYNGSEWQAASGLQLVKKQTIGSGVASVEVTGAFSAEYENYAIRISGGAGGGTYLNMILGAQGAASHDGALVFASYAGGSVGLVGNNNQGFWPYVGSSGTTLNAQIELNSPFLTEQTMLSAIWYDTNTMGNFNGRHSGSTSFTSFWIIPNTGTLTGGTIYVYGYGQ
jgi:hypothetical protein